MENTNDCLILAGAEWPPFLSFKNKKPPWIVEGSNVELLNIIMKLLGHCYTIVRATDNDWGIELPNGSWSGSLGMINRGEVAMSAVVYSVSESRATAVDFSEYVTIDELATAYNRPKLESDMAGFIKPFTFEMWIGTFLCMLVIITSLLVIQYGYSTITSMKSSPRNDLELSQRDDFQHTFWAATSLFGQSMIWEPRSDSIRLLGGIWLLMSFILTTVYRSNLTAMLISPSIRLPFNNFEELAETNATIWIPVGSRIHEALMYAEPGSRLANARKNFYVTANTTTGVAEYLKGTWGLTTTKMTHIYFIHLDFSQTALCKKYIMDEGVFKTTSLSFAFPKKSPMRAKVDRILRRLREFGIVDHLIRKTMANATECLKPIGSEFAGVLKPLALGDLYGVMLVYAGGVVLGTIVFLIEYANGAYLRRYHTE